MTNMEAGSRAVYEALKISTVKGFKQMVLETDSLTLRNIIQRVWKVPWQIAEIMEYIHCEKSRQQVQVNYFFR